MIGNNTVLGFFEAIVDNKKYQQLVTRFWSKVPSDPFYNRNIIRDRKNNEIRYNSVEPETGGREVHEEVTVLKLENYIKKRIKGSYEVVIEKIDEKVEKLSINECIKFLNIQRDKLDKIEEELPASKVIKTVPDITDVVSDLKDFVDSRYALLNTDQTPGFSSNEMDLLTKEFAENFAAKPKSKMSFEAIDTYLKLYERYKNQPDFRAITKRNMDKRGFNYTTNFALTKMEESWREFLNSRTSD